MKQQVEELKTNISTLEAFVEKYELDLPENLYTISMDLTLLIRAHYAPNQDGINKVLAAVGQAFGRQGWTSSFDRYNNRHDWQRTIDGITITVIGAELGDEIPQKVPVPSSRFPILLEDKESE